MAIRLDHPLTVVAEFSGTVLIGRFDDGTLIVASKNDEPLIIRDGQIRRLKIKHPNGDMEFEGAVSAAGVLAPGQTSTQKGGDAR